MVKYKGMKIYFIPYSFAIKYAIKLMNNVTVLLIPVHAERQCIDKGSFLKMTSFRQLVSTQVLV